MQRGLGRILLAAAAVPLCLAAYQRSPSNVANLPRKVQAPTDQNAPIPNLPAGVLGVAIGPSFKLNGATVPDNANLVVNAVVSALDKAVRIHLKDDCDYLLAPNSQVEVEDHKLILEFGKLRARHAGSCKVGAGFYLVSGDPDADGLISYSGGNLEVASMNGTIQVYGSQGALAGTVSSGADSTFGAAQTGASGATASGPSGATATGAGTSGKALALYTGALAAALAGLGIAVDALLQPSSSSTSP